MKTGGSLKLGAIIIGWLVDVVGSALAGVIASAIIIGPAVMSAAKRAAQNPSVAQNQAEMQARGQALANQMTSGGLPLTLLIIGGLFSILGGFVAARIAKQAEFKNGLAVGVLSLLLSLFFLFIRRDFSAPANAGWYGSIAPFVGVPLAAFGGYLGSFIRRSDADETMRSGSPPLPPV